MSGLPILGVDAGGTGTRAVLVRDGAVVSRYTEGPLNILLHEDAFDRLVNMIKESDASAAGLGLAGLRGSSEADRLETQLRARTGVAVVVGDDVEVALLGAFDGGPGIVVASGTGSNAFGRDADGRAARVGGHGFLLGDEGSSYWIGSRAVRAALRSYDGTGPKAPALEQAVKSSYGLDLDAVVRRIHSAPADRQLVSRLTRVVLGVDDPVMSQIAEDAADHLIKLAEALRHKLGAELPVAMHGGVFQDPTIRRRFVAATGAVDPAQTAEFGAVLLASSGERVRDMGWVG